MKYFALCCSLFLLVACQQPQTDQPNPTKETFPTNQTHPAEETVHTDTTIQYGCAQKKIVTVQLTENFKKATVTLPTIGTQAATTFEATTVPSANGMKYEGEGYIFWSKGDYCLVQKGEELIYQDCNEIQVYTGFFADTEYANLFVNCANDFTASIMMEGNALQLKKQYEQLTLAEETAFVQFKGYLSLTDEEDTDIDEMLKVTEVLKVSATETCKD